MDLSLSLDLTKKPPSAIEAGEVAKLLKAMAKPLMPFPLHGKVEGGPAFDLDTLGDIAKVAGGWKPGPVVSLVGKDKDFEASIVFYEDYCTLEFFFFEAFVARHAARLVADCGQALRSTLTALDPDGWCVSWNSGLLVRNFDYPWPRPGRSVAGARRHRLIDVADPRAGASDEENEAAKTLGSATLPKGVDRETIGPIILIEWAPKLDLGDTEAVKRGLMDRERWLLKHLPSSLDPEWNKAGDLKSGFMGGEPHPLLTLFAPALGEGYKAIHGAAPAGEIDKTLEQVAGWIKAGRVDARTKVSDVTIIADSRKTAIALKSRMTAKGVAHVIYPDDDKVMWDPFPDGDWIDDR